MKRKNRNMSIKAEESSHDNYFFFYTSILFIQVFYGWKGKTIKKEKEQNLTMTGKSNKIKNKIMRKEIN